MTAMNRETLAVAALLCGVAFTASSQAPTVRRDRKPARVAPAPPRARSDTTPASKDSLTSFTESFSFRNLGPAAYSGRVTALAVPHAAGYPNTFYVGAAGGGVWKTTNGGITWQSVSEGLGVQTIGDLAVARSDTNIVWVGTGEKNSLRSQWWGDGVYKSVDGGKSWTKLTDPALKNGLPTDRLGRIGLALSAKDPKVVYATIQVDRGVTDPLQGRYGGVFRSSDAGATWTQVNDLQAIPHYYYDDIWIDPTNPDHVWTVSPALLESKDGGKSFAPDSLHLVHGDYHALWIDRGDPQHLIIGNDGGVYVSRDGGKAWEHMAIPIGQFYTVVVDSSLTPYQVCGGLQDNGVWCGPSRTRDTLGITDGDWYPVNGGDGMWVQIPANDPYTVYSGWQFGHVSRLDLRTWKRDDITPLALDAGQESGLPRVRLSSPGRLRAARVPHGGSREDLGRDRKRTAERPGKPHRVRGSGEPATPLGRHRDRGVRDPRRWQELAAARQEPPQRPRRIHGAVVRTARPRGLHSRARCLGHQCGAARADDRHAARGTDSPVRRRPAVPIPPARHLPRLGQRAVRGAESAAGRRDHVLPQRDGARWREARRHHRGGRHDPSPHGPRVPVRAARHVGSDPRQAAAARAGRPDVA